MHWKSIRNFEFEFEFEFEFPSENENVELHVSLQFKNNTGTVQLSQEKSTTFVLYQLKNGI